MPVPGEKAPELVLPDQEGKNRSLKELLGKKVVLYFYPRDNTTGCTAEACSFQDNLAKIRKAGAEVIGVSADSVVSHKKFGEKYQLRFPLLSDEEKRILKSYDVWKTKSMYGRKFKGIERTTYLIDENGMITHVFPKVKVNGHVDEILEVLKKS